MPRKINVVGARPQLITAGQPGSRALEATKLHVCAGHVVAGPPSFNRSVPEELDRVAANHSSDVLPSPSEVTLAHIENEGWAERGCPRATTATSVVAVVLE